MKKFEEFFTDQEITSYLCTLRSRQANNRNKKNILYRLSTDKKYNYHVNEPKNLTEYAREFNDQLNELLPKRRQWIEPKKKGRINNKTGCKLSTPDKNASAIEQTIGVYRKKHPEEKFLKNLDNFIIDIQETVNNPDIIIKPPHVCPQYKNHVGKGEENKPRPISNFNLKERLILSFTNKYLTQLFDEYFQENSFAFRARNKTTNHTPTHHDCIKKIKSYREKFNEKELWVVECDMKKFYDSVSHNLIREHFYKLMDKAKENHSHEDLTAPTRIFEAYLNCYSFNFSVLPLKNDPSYWREHLKNVNSSDRVQSYEWVCEEIIKRKYYENIFQERIGIPQGGALSGLIANIVLDGADREMKKSPVFYARYCDDMMIIHPDKQECENAKQIYVAVLESLKLVPHSFCRNEDLLVQREKPKMNLPPTTIQPFWRNKSKGPYKWSSIDAGGFPWIGFLGYELHYLGHTRIRKSSMTKELLKQQDVFNKICGVMVANRRKCGLTACESAIHTLVGMSVGRVTLANYKTIKHELCWVTGFRELTRNKYSIQQLKQLDRNRNKLYNKLVKKLKRLRPDEKEDSGKKKHKERKIIKFKKPFSYYYHAIERKDP